MHNLKTIFSSFKFFNGEEDILNELVPKIGPLLQAEKDISQQSVFKQYYRWFVMDVINYSAIVGLFEDMIKVYQTRKNRQKYLLAHWLYYQTFKVNQDITQQGTMELMKLLLEKKQEPEKIIDEIAAYYKFGKDQSTKLKQNIKSSSIYNKFVKYLTTSSQLSPEKVEQKHKQLLFIIQKMPNMGQSIELQLQKHIIVSFQRAYGKQSEEGVKAQKNLIQLEHLFKKISEQNRNTSKIRAKLDELKTIKDQKKRYNILESIKSELTILDVYLLNYLIAQSQRNSSEQNGESEPKNIVLFVGPSGSGKTTIILKLLGYDLIQTQIQQLPTLQPVDLLPEHSALRTSPESISTTRYMFSFRIPQKSFYEGSFEKLEACDSPGFEGSAGCEVDISNSISIQRFLMGCASVKLAVVISQRKVGDKMEGIREVAKMVSSFVTKYSEIKDDVLIVLNKFEDQKEYNRIKPGIQYILKNLTPIEQADREYVAFLIQLLKKIKSKRKTNLIRFDPFETNIPQFVQQMKEGKITEPRKVFRYSLSSKSIHYISIRITLLVKLVRDFIGRDNSQAFYYFSQLVLLSQCLNQQADIAQEVIRLKKFIKGQVDETFKFFQRKIEEQVLKNNSNRNIFRELYNIKENIKSFQIFANFIDEIVTPDKIQLKIKEIKQKMLREELSFDNAAIEQSKKKVVRTIKFLAQFQSPLQKQVIEKLKLFYYKYKQQLKIFLNEKRYDQIRNQTFRLKNLMQVIQKGTKAMEMNADNLKKMEIIDKNQFNAIIQQINEQFERIAKQSIKFISQFKLSSNNFEINKEKIAIINKYLNVFRQIEAQGSSLNVINATKFKKLIIDAICIFLQETVDKLNKIFDSKNIQVDQSQLEFARHQKFIIKHFKEFKQVKIFYGILGMQISALWTNLQRIILIQTNKLKRLFNQLKNQKNINRDTLKDFIYKIDKIIKFSQGDDNLIQSTNQLKIEIKNLLGEHIENLKIKIDKLKITLKLKRTLEMEKLCKIFQYFKEIQVFYRIKQFRQQQYLLTQIQSTNNTNLQAYNKKKLGYVSGNKNKGSFDNQNDYDDYDDRIYYKNINVSKLIKDTYTQITKKILNPFTEIIEQTKKINYYNLNNISVNYLQMVNYFIQYKSNLFENEAYLSKDLSAQINQFDLQVKRIFQPYVDSLIKEIKYSFDKICIFIQRNQSSKQIQINKLALQVKQLKKISFTILTVRNLQFLDQLFLQNELDSRWYLVKIVQILQKFKENINQQLVNFTKTHEEIAQQIARIKQSTTLKDLQKFESIIPSYTKEKYTYLCNSVNLILSGLKRQEHKLITTLINAKQLIIDDKSMTLDSQNANNYLDLLQKVLNFHEEITLFIVPQSLANFVLNENYLDTEISGIQIEKKLKCTYQKTKEKILAFEYKDKPQQFQMIYKIIKKAQDILEKMAKNFVNIKFKKILKSLQEDVQQQCKGTKFSGRLNYFMNKIKAQQENVYFNENNLHQISTKQLDLIQKKNQKIDKFKRKNQEEKIKIKQQSTKTIDKLPNKLREQFKNKLEKIK